MDFTAKWSLFGEIIDEEVSLEFLPVLEYITGKLGEDITNFRLMESEDDESGECSVSELVQDVFFVSALSEMELS